MSKRDKIVARILENKAISYAEVETLMSYLGFSLKIKGSHHIFTKEGYSKNISLKVRKELLPYQTNIVKEVLIDHGYQE